MNSEKPESAELDLLLARVRTGDSQALNELLARHRPWVRRFVELRHDPRIRHRVDPSDVVQEVQLEAAQRIKDYLEREPMPFPIWLRQTACDSLIDLRRKHLDAECRSVQREVVLSRESSILFMESFLGIENPPDRRILEQERAQQLSIALDELGDHDREIILLRVFEGLENLEVSQILGIHPSTGSKQFGRAVPVTKNSRAPGK